LVKSKNKFTALQDAYFTKLEETPNTAIVQLYRQREETKLEALEAEKEQLEQQKMNFEGTTRANDLQKKIEKKVARINNLRDRLHDPSFEENSLFCKNALQKYKKIRDEQSQLETELELALENEPADAPNKKNELEIKKREAQKEKDLSTIDLKIYIKSQVRPDLLACPWGLSGTSATAHHVHVRCDACERVLDAQACLHHGMRVWLRQSK
jgi:hypothetical protein